MKKHFSTMSLAIAMTLSTACSKEAEVKVDANATISAQQQTSPQSYLTRGIRDEVFYFVMPDRFYNGDKSNDMGSETIALSRGGFDPTDKNKYHGGDMAGLMAKLDYLQEMGITSIWMTPIMRNQALQGDIAGYHGYWVLDFTQIDPHLGSNADLKRLIDEAHRRDMKVFFDIITNHTADVIKYAECHGEDGAGWSGEDNLCPYKSLAQIAAGDTYTTVIPAGLESAKVPAWLNDPQYYHNQGDSTWQGENSIYGDFIGLDDIDTDNPDVVEGMIDIFKNIVSEFKPDGFRIDTVKHVNMEFWQAFSPAITEHAHSVGIPNFFMFGEVYDANPEFLSQFTTTGKLPSVLDFGFQSMAYQALIEDKGTDVMRSFFEQDDWYNDSDSRSDELLNFVGNHDMGRFAYFLKRERDDLTDEEKVARTLLAHSLMFFTRGVPVVYYGDEQGFVGDGSNQDSRADMMASKVTDYNDDVLLGTAATTAVDNFDTQHPIFKGLQQFSEVYLAHPTLRFGIHKERYAQSEPGLYVISRVNRDTGDEFLVAFNTSSAKASAEVDDVAQGYREIYAHGASLNRQTSAKVTLALPPFGTAIYKGNNRATLPDSLDLEITNLSADSKLSGRTEIHYGSKALDNAPLVPFTLNTWVKIGDGDFKPAAFDETLPLRTIIDVSGYESGTKITLKAELQLEGLTPSEQRMEFSVE